MKILCFIDSLGSGGAQRQLVELAIGFKERGHDVSFLTYHDINFFKTHLDINKISVETIIEPNYLRRLLKVRSVIRANNPDAVLSFLEAANFMATCAGFPRRKWKLVVGERSANPRITKSLKLRLYRWFHLFTDYVVANSNSNIKMVKRVNPLLRSAKLQTIYNIVNIPDNKIEENESTELTNIVIAASYRPVKNLDGLIKAIKGLPNEYQDKLRVDWYGDIDMNNFYYTKMSSIISDLKLGHIINLSDKSHDIFSQFALADFVGLFSHYEGFPNTISEAMAIGRPVIVSRVSDIPIFIKDNINGFLCDSEDMSSIRKALIKAIDSNEEDRTKMGVRNSEIARREFDRKVITDRYLNLLKNV